MLNYNDLYEHLRKEKYGEKLQQLPKDFVLLFSEYLADQKKKFSNLSDIFADDLIKDKKQFENSLSIFREVMLRSKKKILQLVFVAAETGIMKRDYGDMLDFERALFDRLVMAVNDSERELNDLLTGRKIEVGNKMVIMTGNVEEFISLTGEVVGPFKIGDLVNIEDKVAEILVSDGKARFVDE